GEARRDGGGLHAGSGERAARHAGQRRVHADGGARRDLRHVRGRTDRLRAQVADLAGRVGALERREVQHRHGEADALLLGGRLDRALAERGGALLDADAVDMGQAADHEVSMTRTGTLPRVHLCIFCGSSPGARPEYAAATVELAQLLSSRGIGIVYGGASVGLMGLLADTAMAAGGEVVGVIPNALERKEIARRGLTELHVVGSMHERKALMAELSDGFVALPGGSGTLEELFEVFTWSQLGLHRKACALLNVVGYHDGLAPFLDRAVH